MSHASLLAFTNGSAPPIPPFDLLCDLASPFACGSIRCILLGTSRDDTVRRMVGLFSPGEGAAPADWSRLIADEPPPLELGTASPLLKEYARRSLGRGLDFRAELWDSFSGQSLLELSRTADFLVFEESRPRNRTSCPGTAFKSLLMRGHCPVMVCGVPYSGIGRVVVATRADGRLEELLDWGRTWSDRLDVPLAVISAAGTARQLTCQMRAIEQAAAGLGIVARLSGYRCSGPEIARKLDATDLLLMGAYGRAWPIELCFGSRTEEMLRQAHCPVGILPAQGGPRNRVGSGGRAGNSR